MSTERIITAFKERARIGVQNTFADHIIYSIARALQYSESEGEANYLSTKYVLQMVSPVNQKTADNQYNGDRYGRLTNELRMVANSFRKGIFNKLTPGAANSDLAYLVEDRETFAGFCDRLIEATQRHYVYIFVRQDMIFEQQAVQAAHATMVAGAKMSSKMFNGKHFNPQSTHFVLIGVPDKDELIRAQALASLNGIQGSMFYEEDLNDEPTAFCTDVVSHEQRATFREYGLLKMRQPTTTGSKVGKWVDGMIKDLGI